MKTQGLRIGIVYKEGLISGRTPGLLWPVMQKIVEKGHQVEFISWFNPQVPLSYYSKEIEDGLNVHYLHSQETPLSQEFPSLAEKKVAQLHLDAPFDLVHSIDTPLVKLKKLVSQLPTSKKLKLSYGVETSSLPQMFNLDSKSQSSTKSLFLNNFFLPVLFLKNYILKDRKLLTKADGVFVTTPRQALGLERYYLYPPNKTFQVPLSSNFTQLHEQDKDTGLLEKLNIPKDSKIVLASFDMKQIQQPRELLSCFEKIAVKYKRAYFIIAGQGPMMKSIEKQMLLGALDRRVRFTGYIKTFELAKYISLADVFINTKPSTSGFGPTLLAAMAQKKLIIGSEFSPIAQIINHGENGFLVRPADEGTIVKIILDAFEGRIDVHSLGKKAQDKVREVLDISKIAERSCSAFSKIVS